MELAKKRGKYSFRALIDEIKREEDGLRVAAWEERDPLEKEFYAGGAVGLGIAADIVWVFKERQMQARREREERE